MIRNRNIALDAGINPAKIAGGLGQYRLREVYYTAKSTSAVYTYIQNAVESGHLDDTITESVTKAGDYDVVFVEDGVYDEGAELGITQTGLKLIGSNTSGIEWGPTSIKQSSANHHLISIQANGVEVAGMGFIMNGAYRGIEIDHTGAVYKTHIHGCHFGGSATATYGVYAGGTYDAVDTIIEDCEFLSWATAGVRLNATRSKVRNCLFMVPASGIGIEYVPGGSDRGYCLIADNYIHGSNSSDTGIKFTGAPDAGASAVMCVNNFIAGAATTITATANGSYNALNNYTGATDGAITAIDTDS